MPEKEKSPTWGGKRAGSGRKRMDDEPKASITFSVFKYYNSLYVKNSEFIWELKVEVHNDGFEMMYAVNRKR